MAIILSDAAREAFDSWADNIVGTREQQASAGTMVSTTAAAQPVSAPAMR